MRHTSLILSLFSCLALIGYTTEAQDSTANKKESASVFGGIKLFKTKINLQVRQSLETADFKKEPAALVATFPAGKDNSYLIDGGIGFGLAFKDKTKDSTERFYLQVALEYHRNTLIDKEQHNGQFGLGGEWYLKSAVNRKNWVLNFNPKYVRDVIAKKGSFVFPVEIARLSNWLNRPLNLIRAKKWVGRLVLSPSAGFEYQNTFDAPAEKKDEVLGTIFRSLFKGKASLTINRRHPTIAPLFEIYTNGIIRYDMVNKTKTPGGWHPYLDTGVNLFIRGMSKTSIGLSYVKGEDPVKGLLKQEYWQLAFKFFI